jgi:hypothetical protein
VLPEMEKQARKEMIRMKNEIFKIVTKADAWEKTGRPPISTNWVDTDKTHETGTPMVKSRWVARDFKDPKDKNLKTPSMPTRRSRRWCTCSHDR